MINYGRYLSHLSDSAKVLAYCVTSRYKSSHITRQKHRVNGLSENSEWRNEFEAVDHQSSIKILDKIMIMNHAFKSTSDHDILKMQRPGKLCHPNREPLGQSEVPRSPM